MDEDDEDDRVLPMSGIRDEAGGVESARILSSRKKATNMFIPEQQ